MRQTTDRPVDAAIVPDYALGPHTASLGLTFSQGETLGAQPSGKPVEILTGFRVGDVAYGRPVGVMIVKDGSLLVADEVGGKVWRVTSAAAQPAAAAKMAAH